jgi:Zn-dependent peptidase ImmA (M78 family)
METETLARAFTTMYKQGPEYTVEEIAEIFNRSENAIRLKASRLGLKRPLLRFEEVTA